MDKMLKREIINISIVLALWVIGCFVGKACISRYGNTWLAFSGSAIGFPLIGWLIGRTAKSLLFDHRRRQQETPESSPETQD